MIQEGLHKLIVRSTRVPYFFPINVTHVGGGKGLKLKFQYNPEILAEVKSMEGRRWNPDDKTWLINNSPRNEFAFNYLKGHQVYKHWDQPTVQLPSRYPLMEHQKWMFWDGATYLHDIWAAEMGTGKTLACFALLEYLVCEKGWTGEKWYVGTRASIRALTLERIKWKPKVWFDQVVTYDSLKKIVSAWPAGKPAPRMIFFDESSRIKNPTTQRSQMAKHIADSIHSEYGMDSCIIEMSGSPAPKEPTDWWHQCEIACPGYLKEGNIMELKKRLALVIQKENIITGAAYPHLVTWWDDERKCKHCGQLKNVPIKDQNGVVTGERLADQHDVEVASMTGKDYHAWEPSINEVLKLHQRMKGLVRVIFKKDCMNLPDKVFREIELQPSKDTLRAAKFIAKTSRTTMDMMVRLRELSDGFQYKEMPTGSNTTCPICAGTKVTKEGFNSKGEPYDVQRESIERAEILANWRTEFNMPENYEWENSSLDGVDILKERISNQTERLTQYKDAPCGQCDGTGLVPEFKRESVQVPTPKEDALLEILEDHEDIGRCVTYAGFAGSIDRVCEIVKRNGWEYIRFDGRGVVTSWEMPKGIDPVSGAPWDCLAIFQKLQAGPEQIVFVGHPMAAGMGLTLTASPSIIYWSNDYNAESKIQSQDRIHRPGMDLNRGATIYELLHLPSDRMVLTNLRLKQDLQAMTLGVVKRRLEEQIDEAERR